MLRATPMLTVFEILLRNFRRIDGSVGYVPPRSYLVSAPVSYGLVGIAQLANYAASLDILGVDHSDMIS